MADAPEERPDGERPRERRPRGGDPRGRRPGDEGRPERERPGRHVGGDRATGAPRADARRDRSDRPRRDVGRREAGDRPAFTPRSGAGRRHAAPDRDRRGPVERPFREREDRYPRTAEPELPEEVRPQDLDRAARTELRTLSKENAEHVARHLVMAARLIEVDPALAHEHALAAGRRAGRVAIVRESVAITAYAVGDFALALRELRTFRRISGSDDQIALMVDSERGMGRADRALELGRSVDRAALPVEAQVGLAIAMSGARLDQGDTRAALDELERSPMDLQRVFPWSPQLYAAFAAVHEDLGDAAESARWQARADRAAEVLDVADAEQDAVEVLDEAAPVAPAPEEQVAREQEPEEQGPEERDAEESSAPVGDAAPAAADEEP